MGNHIHMKRTTLFAVATMASLLWIGLLGNVSKAEDNNGIPANPAKTDQVLAMRITAYASVPDETDDTPFITANGTHVRDGIVASNILPFGTRIQIPKLFGNKIFTVEDRMSRRIKNTIDIWMPNVPAAVDFGVAHASVLVLGNATSSPVAEAVAKNGKL